MYVYCDESRQDPGPKNAFMGIGSLWVPESRHDALKKRLKEIASDHGIGSEIKWQKTSSWSIEKYKAIVNAFMEETDVRFRIIVIEQQQLDYDTYHEGDRELGFYKFHYELIVKWLEPQMRYIILLDHKRNRLPGRYAKLEEVLRFVAPSNTEIRRVTAHPDSKQSLIVQLTDLLTGAVTAAWCGLTPGSPKAKLAAYIASCLGRPTLRFASPTAEIEKFNVFRIRLNPPTVK